MARPQTTRWARLKVFASPPRRARLRDRVRSTECPDRQNPPSPDPRRNPLPEPDRLLRARRSGQCRRPILGCIPAVPSHKGSQPDRMSTYVPSRQTSRSAAIRAYPLHEPKSGLGFADTIGPTPMSQSALAADAAVRASLNYIVDTGVKPVNETYGPNGLMRVQSASFVRHVVPITDGRPLRESFSLDTSGFVLADHPTAMQNFLDPAELKSVYYREMEKLIAAESGAKRVHVFDHTLRSGDKETRDTLKIREPVRAVHNDYTEWSGPQRVKDFLPEEAPDLLSRRFAIVQVWRAINTPIEKDPLA